MTKNSKVLKILLGAAVKCNDKVFCFVLVCPFVSSCLRKARFVQQIQKLPPAKQKILMVVIQNELLKGVE